MFAGIVPNAFANWTGLAKYASPCVSGSRPMKRAALHDALAELDRALVLDPFDAELWNLSAAWNNLLERFPEALAAAERAAGLRSPYPKAHINAAWALYRWRAMTKQGSVSGWRWRRHGRSTTSRTSTRRKDWP